MGIRPILSSLFRNKTGALLIAAQVALSLAIVANALYIIRDRLAVAARPSGVDDESVVFNIAIKPLRDPDDKFAAQKRDEMLIAAIPGVSSVAWSNQMPLTQSGWNYGVIADPKQTESTPSAMYFGPGSLVNTLGLKLIDGRDFTAEDVVEIDPDKDKGLGEKAILTKAMADTLFPGTSAVGKTAYIGTGVDAQAIQVVGVVERLQTPWAPASDKAERSTLLAARYKVAYSEYIVRTEPGQRDRVMRDVEAALLKADRGRLIDSDSLEKYRIDRYRDDRSVAWMLIVVTVLLLLVTGSGIVGMATLWVNQRRKQIGVRRALGARRLDILRYFIVENLLITSAGVVAGLLLAMALNQLLISQLELVRLPIGYPAVGALVLWILGVLAVYGPAWRAAAISPAIATRSA